MILATVGLHIAAIVYHSALRKQVLLGPTISGDRPAAAVPPAEDNAPMRLRALLLAALSAGLVAYVVTL